MNTAQIKAYAPKARTDFIKAVTERAARFGIHSETLIDPIEFKGDLAIIGNQAFSKKGGELREKLAGRVKQLGFEMFIRSNAYTWFNRFVAIRYMELHDFLGHGFRVMSNPNGSDIPEILEHVTDVDLPGLDRQKVIELRLAGDKDNELYRMLIIAQCNALNKAMPFLFEKIDNEAELLLPDNLLHSNSPVIKMVQDIDEGLWNDVEIIGWIYQFYISEKKDEVIGKVIKSEDIPAATQLFTPNWIVKYMVQNTLGRMWMATYPHSSLKDRMEYYIEPAEQDPEVQKEIDAATPKELNPEALTFLDPACGSGHILVEAYDILKEIYLERGYRTRDIPRLILEKNLYGLDIDDRAAQLACFVVMMKAREDDRSIFGRDDLKLNVLSIQESASVDVLHINDFFRGDDYIDIRNIIKELLNLFENGKTFGSLILIPENIANKIDEVKASVDGKLKNWGSKSGVQILRKIVDQAWILSKKYDCVVANPPYMGGKGMNSKIKDFLKINYTDVKSDLFSAFIIRNTNFTLPRGQLGFMSPFVWMFISSYEKLRKFLINQKTITSLVQLEYSGFDGATVPICTFTIGNDNLPDYKGGYVRLSDFRGAENQAPKTQEAIKNPGCGWFFKTSASEFKKIPGSPIAYWISKNITSTFSEPILGKLIKTEGQNKTANNDKYLRFFWEVSINNLGKNKKWLLYSKGGYYRKWFGNLIHVVDWSEDARIHYRKDNSCRIIAEKFWYNEGITWTDITSSGTAFRYLPENTTFDMSGPTAFFEDSEHIYKYLCLLNSIYTKRLLPVLNPTLHAQLRDIKSIPQLLKATNKFELSEISKECIAKTKLDWNSYETSWDFNSSQFLHTGYDQHLLQKSYRTRCTYWKKITLDMQYQEEKNNHIFIEAYGLQDELTSEVPLHEITLTCNPHYRYGKGKTEEEYETLLLADTMKELISYAVGCMMGRYSLDEPGLMYANSGNIDFNPTKYQTFPADDDGIIPIMDMDWFEDDAARRFVEFIKTAWPPETLDENLKFIADSLNPKASESSEETIRRYLSTTFFKDHMKTYKKRPIYWLFSSGRQKAFECLVYLHRYNDATLSRMRSHYVTPLQGNIRARTEFLEHEKDEATNASTQKKIQKEIDILKKKQVELKIFDDELRHYADMKISIDLDDGVKVNYGKFGNLLAETKAIAGEK